MARLLGLLIVAVMCGSCSSVQPPTDKTDADRTATMLLTEAVGKLEKQQYAEAVAIIDSAIEMAPRHLLLHYYRAWGRGALGDNAGALEDYDQELLLLPPTSDFRPHVIAARDRCLERLGNKHE